MSDGDGSQSLKLDRFRPRKAVALLESSLEAQLAFLQPWALAQLLAWSVLDQQSGERSAKSEKISARPKIRTRNALRAGLITLALLLDSRLERRERSVSQGKDDVFKVMLNLLLKNGGFAAFVEGKGATTLLRDAKDTSRKLGYVYRIVDYMCRYRKYEMKSVKDPNFSIESAGIFVENWGHEEKTFGPSKIQQIWLQYKNSAPYIFSVCSFCSAPPDQTNSIHGAFDWLQDFCQDQERLTRFVGRAAYAADVLSSSRVRNVRRRDFKDVERVDPGLLPFTEEEKATIDNIDRKAPIA